MSGTMIDSPKEVGNTAQGEWSRSAYVTAPRPSDTDLIRSVLERKGIRPFSPDQLDEPSPSLSQAIREGMGQADLVIAVVGPGEDSNSVFYELGFAEALDKPTLVLLTGEVSGDRWRISGTPYLRFDPSNLSGLEFGIDLFLKAARRGPKPSPPADRSKPIGDLADGLLTRLRRSADALSQAEYEAIIADAIRASGVTSLSRGDSSHEFVDMAVWSDDLLPWVDNPLPIELRMQVGNPTDLGESAMRLLRRIGEAGMKWGLLIYHQTGTDMPNAWMMPNILSIQAGPFIEELKDVGFGKLVRGLRNRRVHGAR